MKFKINNREWEVVELNQKEMQKEVNREYDEKLAYYGLTVYSKQKLFLWEELHKDQKRQTLLHELMHCYIGVYLSFNRDEKYTEEDVADISANSHDIIHNIVEEYFKKKHN